MYYHVIIQTYLDPTKLKQELNLSEEIVHSQFVEPYENGSPLLIDGKPIKLDNIKRIKVLRSESPTTKNAFTVLPDGNIFSIFVSDVTNHFIKHASRPQKGRPDEIKTKSKTENNKIFVVHGHDEGMKHAVARTLEKLNLAPIILHEQPNQGRTIIEKLEYYADMASFAVVLLSPDDLGYKKGQIHESTKSRARQNVVLELGYFIGKLGRHNVATLCKNDPNFEFPSDYYGVLYIPFDNHDWKGDLVNELRSSGYNVNANRL